MSAFANNSSFGGVSSRPRGGFGGGRFSMPGGGRFPASGGGEFGGGGNGELRDRYNGLGSKLRAVDWNQMELPPINKNLYREHPDVTNRSRAEVEQWLADNQVYLDGPNIPRPVFQFHEAGFPEPITKALYKHYVQPTVIQSISWPVALSGKDMISIAKTGSGKTLGFILPAIVHILAQGPSGNNNGPVVLVLLPTRELAQQVEEVTKEYCSQIGLRMVCCFGGASKGPQANDLRRGVEICVATPGRLLDFLESDVTNLMRCSYLVLDEADRMLDMGFEPQIRRIVSNIRVDRQTMMFSATWPKEVRSLAMSFQKDPVFLNVGSIELSANHNIEQHVIVVNEHDKANTLVGLLTNIGEQAECKTIIFVETKRRADELTTAMRRGGWPALCIHGDKTQAERDYVMKEFRAGNIPILLATDVAARGLDVTDIRYVINYDYPNNSEDYVHRIGRTGRRDQKGTSFTLFTPQNEKKKARDLIKVLEEAKQPVSQELTALANGGGIYGGGGRSFGGSGGCRF